MNTFEKIAFGGGCHWCTEAVFQVLKDVREVEQGYVASTDENAWFSEAVIVHFNRKCITLKNLIEIHLHTHARVSNHSMRKKYRSAIYTFNNHQFDEVRCVMQQVQNDFQNLLITEVVSFYDFRPSREEITNYYFKNPNKPFCENYIDPKLKLISNRFFNLVDYKKVNHLSKNT